ncbi:hypothetical protein ABK040_002206 [Willaertia magna]
MKLFKLLFSILFIIYIFLPTLSLLVDFKSTTPVIGMVNALHYQRDNNNNLIMDDMLIENKRIIPLKKKIIKMNNNELNYDRNYLTYFYNNNKNIFNENQLLFNHLNNYQSIYNTIDIYLNKNYNLNNYLNNNYILIDNNYNLYTFNNDYLFKYNYLINKLIYKIEYKNINYITIINNDILSIQSKNNNYLDLINLNNGTFIKKIINIENEINILTNLNNNYYICSNNKLINNNNTIILTLQENIINCLYLENNYIYLLTNDYHIYQFNLNNLEIENKLYLDNSKYIQSYNNYIYFYNNNTIFKYNFNLNEIYLNYTLNNDTILSNIIINDNYLIFINNNYNIILLDNLNNKYLNNYELNIYNIKYLTNIYFLKDNYFLFLFLNQNNEFYYFLFQINNYNIILINKYLINLFNDNNIYLNKIITINRNGIIFYSLFKNDHLLISNLGYYKIKNNILPNIMYNTISNGYLLIELDIPTNNFYNNHYNNYYNEENDQPIYCYFSNDNFTKNEMKLNAKFKQNYIQCFIENDIFSKIGSYSFKIGNENEQSNIVLNTFKIISNLEFTSKLNPINSIPITLNNFNFIKLSIYGNYFQIINLDSTFCEFIPLLDNNKNETIYSKLIIKNDNEIYCNSPKNGIIQKYKINIIYNFINNIKIINNYLLDYFYIYQVPTFNSIYPMYLPQNLNLYNLTLFSNEIINNNLNLENINFKCNLIKYSILSKDSYCNENICICIFDLLK